MNRRGWECLLVLGVLLTVGLSLSGMVRQKTDRALEDVRGFRQAGTGWRTDGALRCRCRGRGSCWRAGRPGTVQRQP
ncbi:MAG: hypothetical protein ACLU9S_00300 [Oscillospiraceae bacterium]